MRSITHPYLALLFVCIIFSCGNPEEPKKIEVEEVVKGPNIVFVTGDEEYRSEESMPMLAELAKRELNATVTVCYALDSLGFVDPNNVKNIEGLEALKTADLMVLFTRFRALPESQVKYILDYAESGKPMMGFRTSTHAFQYKNDLEKGDLNEKWPFNVFGQKWIVHHGHFDDGKAPLTRVSVYANHKNHPAMRGVKPFKAHSWLYHVEGNGHQLAGDSEPLMDGESLRSNYAESEEYPLSNPVTWTKTYTGKSGKAARVFFTTLGHPYDFKEISMRKLAMNGIVWALGKEETIPVEGFNVEVANYDPNNSGFGDKFKSNMKPRVFN